ncbi:MAG: undecaprenyl/decaprenyl-phosphate alpha-N-acetylglucosaminyl 1-phosphate transferase [Geobacteraceae bacterium]|nr:undecaprenyl/decaprenyl-phosphate alpha-N-acetylglucosaminyl 1-phosphate transferase [Geobacteraceae bacterium]
MIFLFTLLISVLITIALIPVFGRLAVYGNVLDMPNERKVHALPIPRIGGAAMALGAFVPVVACNLGDSLLRPFLAGGAVLVGFGLADDFRGLSPRVKFLGQFIAALIVVLSGGVVIRSLGGLLPDNTLLPTWFAVPFTIIAIMGVTNAINLSDGLDGLAGGISLLSFCCIAYLAYLEGDHAIGLAALGFIGAIFGFLRFNTHPATIFMGDTGSQLLGFSVVTLALALTQRNSALSPLLPLVLLGFPVLDTLTVMITRIVQGRSPFAADKNHFHHVLLELGLRHPESVLVIYLIQTVLVLSAVSFRFHSDWLLLGGYLLFSAAVISFFAWARRSGWRVKRFDLLDIVIAGNLRKLRDSGCIYRILLRGFAVGVPLLLLVACFLPAEVPGYVTWGAVSLAAVIAIAWFVGRKSLCIVLRPALYLLIPFAVYLGDASVPPWPELPWTRVYNALFGVFALGIILISKFSRRKRGFRSTPLDFLVLLIVAVIPNLPLMQLQDFHLGLVAAKVIMLYFSYELLLAELGGRFDRIAGATVVSLLVLGTR